MGSSGEKPADAVVETAGAAVDQSGGRSDHKIGASLAASLENSGGADWLDVVVELAPPAVPGQPPSGRAERIAAVKAAFARQASPVLEAIRRLGGEVTGEAWINGSLSARVAKKCVHALAREAEVTRVDLPQALSPDAK